MKNFTLIMFFGALGATALLFMDSQKGTEPLLPVHVEVTMPGDASGVRPVEKMVAVRRGEKEAEGKSESVSAPEFREEGDRGVEEGAECMLFGPLETSMFPELRSRLAGSGLIDRMLIERDDRVLRVVYAGPYSSRMLAEKALALLTGKGLNDGAVMAVPGGAWGVRIAQTRDRATADRWARMAAETWSLTNVVVGDAEKVGKRWQLVFPGLSEEEGLRLKKVLEGFPSASFTACPR